MGKTLYSKKNINLVFTSFVLNGQPMTRPADASNDSDCYTYTNSDIFTTYRNELTRENTTDAILKFLGKPLEKSQLKGSLQWLIDNDEMLMGYNPDSYKLLISMVDKETDELDESSLLWLERAKDMFDAGIAVSVGDELDMSTVYQFASQPELVYSVRNKSQLNSSCFVHLLSQTISNLQ